MQIGFVICCLLSFLEAETGIKLEVFSIHISHRVNHRMSICLWWHPDTVSHRNRNIFLRLRKKKNTSEGKQTPRHSWRPYQLFGVTAHTIYGVVVTQNVIRNSLCPTVLIWNNRDVSRHSLAVILFVGCQIPFWWLRDLAYMLRRNRMKRVRKQHGPDGINISHMIRIQSVYSLKWWSLFG